MNFISAFLAITSLLGAENCQGVNSNIYNEEENPDIAQCLMIPEGFSQITGNGRELLFMDTNDGYVTYHTELFRAPFTSSSDLYIRKLNMTFVPGYVARQNNVKQPNGEDYNDTRLSRGYIHIDTESYKNGEKRGGLVIQKAAWPTTTTSETTITSSFGASLSFSHSHYNEVELGGNATLSILDGVSNKTSLSLQYTKSISTTADDPRISAQYNPRNLNEAQWNYEVANINETGKRSYSMTCYYMFEMNHDYRNCGKSAHTCRIDISMTGFYYDWLGIGHNAAEFKKSLLINSCL